MAQFKRDRKISFLSPLTSIHYFSEIRSHGAEVDGRDFATLYDNEPLLLISLANEFKVSSTNQWRVKPDQSNLQPISQEKLDNDVVSYYLYIYSLWLLPDFTAPYIYSLWTKLLFTVSFFFLSSSRALCDTCPALYSATPPPCWKSSLVIAP